MTSRSDSKSVFWALAQPNILQSCRLDVSVPRNSRFRRIYLGWHHYQLGDIVLKGKIRFLTGSGSQVGDIPFAWSVGISSDITSNTELWCPAFTVNRRVYGAGNAFPYEIPVNQNSKVMSYTYQEFGGGTTYHVQICAQPYSVPIDCENILVDFDVTSGIVAASFGGFHAFVNVDSSPYPL